MKVSVIVATKNRPKELATLLLPTLLSQTRPADQLIFVDQSSDEATKNVVEAFAARVDSQKIPKTEFLYLYETNHIGAASARNSGIEKASGDVLLFLDDDVVLEPDFMQELLAIYERFPETGGVSGVITNYGRPSLPARIMTRLFWVGPFHDERQPIYWNADQLRDHEPFRVRRFGAGLMSVKRAVLDCDRFDNHYRGAGAEDVELSWRLSERGPLLMTPKARLEHVRTVTGRPKEHWLGSDALQTHYLYGRIWNRGFTNRLCFAWLNLGYAVLATLASLRHFSIEPWRSVLRGRKSGREFGRVNRDTGPIGAG